MRKPDPVFNSDTARYLCLFLPDQLSRRARFDSPVSFRRHFRSMADCGSGVMAGGHQNKPVLVRFRKGDSRPRNHRLPGAAWFAGFYLPQRTWSDA